MRFIFITMDGNHGAALRNAAATLHREHGVELGLGLYDATSLRNAADWERLSQDVAKADFVFGSRLFGEDFVRPLDNALTQATCPVCIITSNPTLMNHTRIGKFKLGGSSDADHEPGLLRQWMSKLRPKGSSSEASRQLAILRNLSKVLKLIPGKARDLYTYIAAHQYWLNGSPDNLYRMLCLLVERYVPGYKGKLPVRDPIIYPDVAIVHPNAPQPFESLESYEKWRRGDAKKRKRSKGRAASAAPESEVSSAGSVGLLILRTVALSGNTAHIDALVRALETRGIEVRMAYASGLDMRPAIKKFFLKSDKSGAQGDGRKADIDVLINGTGFSLVGGPAESRPDDARAALEELDVAYLNMIPLAFQRVEEWRNDDTGLVPIHLVMNVAIPELDGAVEPLVFGGPSLGSDSFVALMDQIEWAANRIARRVALNHKSNAEKHIAIAIFSFPPNLGNIGTAAYLDVFASLHQLLQELKANGYSVEAPASVEALRSALTEGNALQYGSDGNVAAQLSVDDYRKLFPGYVDIEPFWGGAPGELLNDGRSFYVLGRKFGNVFVGIQPSFGYERDPMRLLMAKDAAPHHGFAAFYTWIDRVFDADAIIHFGTHGAMEFMPGKQSGLSSTCWPFRLLGGLPSFYYYSMNNPSEATIAKRRGASTTISYLTPPLQQAGLYKGLRLLKDTLDRYRQSPDASMLEDIRLQADKLGIGVELKEQALDEESYVAALAHELIQIEQRMIPMGLHVLGQAPSPAELVDFLALSSAFARPRTGHGDETLLPLPELVANGMGWDYETIRDTMKHDRTAQERWEKIDKIIREAMRRFIDLSDAERKSAMAGGRHGSHNSVDAYLSTAANIKPGSLAPLWHFLGDLLDRIVHDREMYGLVHSLNGGYIPPVPGNDVVRNPATVPTGRNIQGLDPYRVPSAVAMENGARLMIEMLERQTQEQGGLPETVAMVLWGTDNLKSDCEGVAQVLALLGVRTIVDELGNVSNIALIPLSELKRPRIDAVVTVSGIFRDLLSHQMTLLDKAVRLVANADEPVEFNFVRKHALQQAQELGISLDEAATRVFANAPGSYGGNINNLVESGTWDEESQLSDAFLSRKSFAMGVQGETSAGQQGWRNARSIMERALSTVDLSFQNIDSFEVGISDIDVYYESLGGVTKSVEVLSGKRPPVMVADAVATNDRLGTLEQMVRLETRAKLLNPKWYEAMLNHGYEGVREIESRVNNTYGWSATAGAVEDWVYQGVAETFVLDEAMRKRLSQLNPHAAAGTVRRLLEANSRGFWNADEETLNALYEIYTDLEDLLEGVGEISVAQ